MDPVLDTLFAEGFAKYSKTPKIQNAESILLKNKWDTEAWEVLLSELSAQHIDCCREVFDYFFKLFPCSAKYWRLLVTREMQARNFDRVEQILQDTLLQLPSAPLWQVYLDYVKETKGKEEVERAYEFALDTIGNDMNSSSIWMFYFEFMNQQRADGLLSHPRIITLRKRFKEVLEYQVHRLEEFWKMYEKFETENFSILYSNGDKAASSSHLREVNQRFKTSLVIYKDKRQLREHLQEDYLPVPPHVTSSPYHLTPNPSAASSSFTMLPNMTPMGILPRRVRGQLQFSLWTQLIEYEKSNVQRLPPEMLHKRVTLLYNQALMCTYYSPEMWYAAAVYQMNTGHFDDAAKYFERALKALPSHELLHFAYADYLGSRKQTQRATELFEKLLTTATKEGADSTLIWIQYLKFTRRNLGQDEVRKLFMKCKKTARWQTYAYIANMEWRLNKEPKVARNIFELGMQSFDNELGFVMSYLQFLMAVNDENNLRVVFEKVLKKGNSLEAWNTYLEWEHNFGNDQSAKAVEDRMAEALPTLEARGGLRKLVSKYSYLDLTPLDDAQLRALEQQEVTQLALCRHTASRLDGSTFSLIYKNLDIEATSPVPFIDSTRGQRVSVPQALPTHTNAVAEALVGRIAQPNFAQMATFTPPPNPTPPDPLADQTLDLPSLPPNYFPARPMMPAPGMPMPSMGGVPGMAAMPMGMPMAAMPLMAKEEDLGFSLQGGAPPLSSPLAPKSAYQDAGLPAQLLHLLCTLPATHLYTGPLPDVQYILNMLRTNTLPSSPDHATDASRKRPPEANHPDAPEPKREHV